MGSDTWKMSGSKRHTHKTKPSAFLIAALFLGVAAFVVYLIVHHKTSTKEGFYGNYERPHFKDNYGAYPDPNNWVYYRPMYYFGQPSYNHYHWWKYPYGYYYGPWSRPTTFDTSHEKYMCERQCGEAKTRCETENGKDADECVYKHEGCTEGCNRDARWFAY